MSAIETTRIIRGSPAYFCRSAPGDFVVVRHRGTELFLAHDKWLALPEIETAAVSAANDRRARGRGALRIAALFVVLAILQAIETMMVLVGTFFRKIGAIGRTPIDASNDTSESSAVSPACNVAAITPTPAVKTFRRR